MKLPEAKRNHLIISLIMSFLGTLLLNLMQLINSFSKHGPPYPSSMTDTMLRLHQQMGADRIYHLLFTFITFLVLFYFIFKLIDKKIWVKLTAAILIGVSITFLFIFCHSQLLSLPELIYPISKMYFFRTFLIIAFVLVTVQSVQLSTQQKKAEIESQKLKAENIQTQFNALKNQLNPHFLFNSLTTLNSIISEDNADAQEYIQKMSSVLRYTLQSKDLVPLAEELDFMKSYFYLLKIRYGESLNINIDINPKYNNLEIIEGDEILRAIRHNNKNYDNWKIIPLGLQILLENAIKHNVISNKQPLTINIYTTDRDTIVIENQIQPKIEIEPGNGIGLCNLKERYKILTEKDITITSLDNIFRVEIPLIKSS